MRFRNGFLSTEFPDYEGYLLENKEEFLETFSIIKDTTSIDPSLDDDALNQCISTLLAMILLDDSVSSLSDIVWPLPMVEEDEDKIIEFANLIDIMRILFELESKGLVKYDPENSLWKQTELGKEVCVQLGMQKK
jgi:hypothetical protein